MENQEEPEVWEFAIKFYLIEKGSQMQEIRNLWEYPIEYLTEYPPYILWYQKVIAEVLPVIIEYHIGYCRRYYITYM